MNSYTIRCVTLANLAAMLQVEQKSFAAEIAESAEVFKERISLGKLTALVFCNKKAFIYKKCIHPIVP